MQVTVFKNKDIIGSMVIISTRGNCMVIISSYNIICIIDKIGSCSHAFLVLFRKIMDPAVLPIIFASSLEKSDSMNVKDLILMVEKRPTKTMFENPVLKKPPEDDEN